MADGDEQAAAEGTFEGEAANNALTELERFEYTGLSGDVAELCASRRAEVSKATSSEAEQDFLARLEKMQKGASNRVSALRSLRRCRRCPIYAERGNRWRIGRATAPR